MTGYHGDADRTAEAMAGGYYRTGDIGARDEDGYITYVGRADDVFKASDYKISPFELESALLEHEAVAEAAVVPAPDELRLAVPKAYIVLATGHAPGPDLAKVLFEHSRTVLAPYKRIRRLEFGTLPKTISGKIRRIELREATAMRLGRRVPRGGLPVSALSYAHGTSATTLLGDTIGANLDRAVAAWPDREALVDVPSGRRWTYAQFSADVDELAYALLATGIARGDRVGIWAVNCPEWVLVQYATARVGAVMVNINPAYRTHEVEYVLQQAGISLLFASLSHKTSDYRAMVEQVRGRCPQLRETVYIGDPSWDALIGRGTPDLYEDFRVRRSELSCDDPINIQYTSGTTGFPKGRPSPPQHPQQRLFRGRVDRLQRAGPDLHPRALLPLLRHGDGQSRRDLARRLHGHPRALLRPGCDTPRGPGRALHLAVRRTDDVHRGVEPPRLRDVRPVLAAHRHHGGLAVPGRGDEAGGRRDAHGGGLHLLRHDRDLARVPADPQGRRLGAPHRHRRPGAPAPGGEGRRPGGGVTQPRGIAGELCTRGYSVMLGYWNEPEKTAEAVDAGRWMHTGDLAVMREDGYVEIVGRIKDMIIRGGENIYPREIEEFLYAHPKIADVQVVGVPHERYGEEVLACVIPLDPADPLTLEELRAFCEGRLAHYKIPSRLQVLESFPMTVSGKVRKIELRQTYAE